MRIAAIRDEAPGVRTYDLAFRDGPAGRRPGLAACGLDVWEVVETVQDHGGSVEEAAGYLAIDPQLVGIAVRYYAAFRDEIDAWIAANRELADRELALYQQSSAERT